MERVGCLFAAGRNCYDDDDDDESLFATLHKRTPKAARQLERIHAIKVESRVIGGRAGREREGKKETERESEGKRGSDACKHTLTHSRRPASDLDSERCQMQQTPLQETESQADAANGAGRTLM